MAKLYFTVSLVAAMAVTFLITYLVMSSGKLLDQEKSSTDNSGLDKPPDHPKSITVAELNELPVIGLLGKPLGICVTIEGVVADGSYTKRKVDSGATLLRVQTVDGEKLANEQIFHFRVYDWSNVDKPKIGSMFKYIGYEDGGFAGTIGNQFDWLPVVAAPEYSFTTSFVIVRDENNQN